jgi:hypothetical protein
MNTCLLARAALVPLMLLLAPGLAGGADAERARHPTCTGIYTGAARGVFWCKVVLVHDPKTDRSTLRIDTDEDIQMTGDALAVTPGSFVWKGPPAVGVLKSPDAPVVSAWSTLQTGVPPTQADYGAAHAAPQHPIEQGQLSLMLTAVAPGEKVEGGQAFAVHGTFSARLLPLPGAKAVGDVHVNVTF